MRFFNRIFPVFNWLIENVLDSSNWTLFKKDILLFHSTLATFFYLGTAYFTVEAAISSSQSTRPRSNRNLTHFVNSILKNYCKRFPSPPRYGRAASVPTFTTNLCYWFPPWDFLYFFFYLPFFLYLFPWHLLGLIPSGLCSAKKQNKKKQKKNLITGNYHLQRSWITLGLLTWNSIVKQKMRSIHENHFTMAVSLVNQWHSYQLVTWKNPFLFGRGHSIRNEIE